MNPVLSHALGQTLLHHGSGEDAVTQLSVSRQEFKEAYYAVENQIPGRTLDFEKLAQKDPIESDPLVAQGNLSILRLDDLYRETFQAVNIVLASFRIQATLTHRREQLTEKRIGAQRNGPGGGGELPPKDSPKSNDFPGNSPPKQQPKTASTQQIYSREFASTAAVPTTADVKAPSILQLLIQRNQKRLQRINLRRLGQMIIEPRLVGPLTIALLPPTR